MSMNLMDSAEKQFNVALEVTIALSFLFGMILFLRLLLSAVMFLLRHVFNTCTVFVVTLSIIHRLCSVYVVGSNEVRLKYFNLG